MKLTPKIMKNNEFQTYVAKAIIGKKIKMLNINTHKLTFSRIFVFTFTFNTCRTAQ